MANNITEEIANAYDAAKRALDDDLMTKFYSAAETRRQAFRQLNNTANKNHALFSGAPAAMQMSYDSNTYLPGIASLAEKAIETQVQNQETWDQYMEYVKDLNSKAQTLRDTANNMNQVMGNSNVSTSGGSSSVPEGSAYTEYSEGQ